MDTVIIIGADGEPSPSLARRLCGMGIRVYAIAGTIPENGLTSDEFIPVPCDLTSPRAVETSIKDILKKEPHVVGTILAGQYLSEERFEAVSTEEIALALNAQVISPLCAVRLALPTLIAGRGHVIVISPGSGSAAGRTLNAVADAALRSFTGTLFAELRDTGVKTCHILLQNNEGAPDPATRFTTTPQSRVHADIVADAVETVFRLRENNALTQMILRPQATRETPHIPISTEPKIRTLQNVQLPPARNFPKEDEPIPTLAYRRPDYAPAKNTKPMKSDDDEENLADDYVDPELRYLVRNSESQPHHRQNQQQQTRKNPQQNNGRATDQSRKSFGRNTDSTQNNREGRNQWHNRNRPPQNRNFENGIRPPQKISQNTTNTKTSAPSAEEEKKPLINSPQRERPQTLEKTEKPTTPLKDTSVKKGRFHTPQKTPLEKNKGAEKRSHEKISPPLPEKKKRPPQKRKVSTEISKNNSAKNKKIDTL